MKIKKDDTVLITKGRDRGQQGQVQKVLQHKERIIVEGVNLVKRHMRAQGMRAAEIIEKEMPLPASNVMLICTHCLAPTRVEGRVLGDGTKARVCKRCEEVIE